jgi:hypothetical protein
MLLLLEKQGTSRLPPSRRMKKERYFLGVGLKGISS